MPDSCCVSVQGLHPSKDPDFAVLKPSPAETSLTASAFVKWDGPAFGALPGCVTRCFTLLRSSDDLRHAISPFSLFLSTFSGMQRILGYVRSWRIVAVHPPKTGERRSIWRSLQTGTAFTWRCVVIGLQMLLLFPELRHRKCPFSFVAWVCVCGRDTGRSITVITVGILSYLTPLTRNNTYGNYNNESV